MSETLRWSLEVAFLVAISFALGAGAMALVLRVLLPGADEEPDSAGPSHTVGAAS